jgi:hypothetical protein
VLCFSSFHETREETPDEEEYRKPPLRDFQCWAVYQEHMPLQSGKDVKSDASQRAICHEEGKIAGDSSWDHRIMGVH